MQLQRPTRPSKTLRWLVYLPRSFTERSRAHSAPPSVTVAVDEMHATAVTGILNLYGPRKIEERAAQSHRH